MNTFNAFIICKNVLSIAAGAYFAALAFAAVSNVVLAVLAAIAVYFVAETVTSVALVATTWGAAKLVTLWGNRKAAKAEWTLV